MKSLACLVAVLLATTSLAAPPKGGPRYETDRGTIGFLRRHLVSGGDIQYPIQAVRAKQQGSGFYLMKLANDGAVLSVTVKKAVGYKQLDDHVVSTLKGYRFKPKTKGPLLWLVSFAQPATVIVKAYKTDGNVQLPPSL